MKLRMVVTATVLLGSAAGLGMTGSGDPKRRERAVDLHQGDRP